MGHLHGDGVLVDRLEGEALADVRDAQRRQLQHLVQEVRHDCAARLVAGSLVCLAEGDRQCVECSRCICADPDMFSESPANYEILKDFAQA